jgi:hypothetical protein
MKVSKIVLTFVLSFLFLRLNAQTADDIIHKWVEAMGGKEKLSKIQTIYTENDVTILNNPGTSKTYAVNGKGFKSETDFNGQKIIDCYTVNGGWSVNPLAGQPTAVNMPASQIKMGERYLQIAGPLFDYAAKGGKVEFQGKEDVNGSSAYKILLTTAGGLPVLFYISDSSYHILKETLNMSTGGQDIEISTVYTDYRKTEDGYVMAFSYELNLGGLSVTVTSKKIEVNKDISSAIFDMPKN